MLHHCSTGALPLLYHCSTGAPPLLYHCSTIITLPLLYHCSATALPLLYHCSTTALPLLYHCFTTALPLLYHCSTIITLPLLYQKFSMCRTTAPPLSSLTIIALPLPYHVSHHECPTTTPPPHRTLTLPKPTSKVTCVCTTQKVTCMCTSQKAPCHFSGKLSLWSNILLYRTDFISPRKNIVFCPAGWLRARKISILFWGCGIEKRGFLAYFGACQAKVPVRGWCKINISRVRGWCGSVKLKCFFGAADWTQVCTVHQSELQIPMRTTWIFTLLHALVFAHRAMLYTASWQSWKLSAFLWVTPEGGQWGNSALSGLCRTDFTNVLREDPKLSRTYCRLAWARFRCSSLCLRSAFLRSSPRMPPSCNCHVSLISRVGQDRIYTPYMTVYLVISLPKLLYIHHIYIYDSGQPYSFWLRCRLSEGKEEYLQDNSVLTNVCKWRHIGLILHIWSPALSRNPHAVRVPCCCYDISSTWKVG